MIKEQKEAFEDIEDQIEYLILDEDLNIKFVKAKVNKMFFLIGNK